MLLDYNPPEYPQMIMWRAIYSLCHHLGGLHLHGATVVGVGPVDLAVVSLDFLCMVFSYFAHNQQVFRRASRASVISSGINTDNPDTIGIISIMY